MVKINNVISNFFLSFAVTTWFTVSVIGQFIFALYVMLFYGKASFTGHSEYWNKVLPNGYVPGDLSGNLVVGFHLLFAVIIIIAGPLQLLTKVRNRFLRFHRWNGRIYIFLAYILSITGLIMVWVRGSIGGLAQHISISINAVLILIAATLTIKFAIARKFKIHRNWSIRLYLLVSGVWFFRIGFFFWLFINKGHIGYNPKTFEGPFLTSLSVSQYAVPLLLFELYLFAQRKNNRLLYSITAIILLLFTLFILIGLYAVTKSKWFPMMLND